MGLAIRRVDTQMTGGIRNLSNPTYLNSVIASLLWTVQRGRNRGYDTC